MVRRFYNSTYIESSNLLSQLEYLKNITNEKYEQLVPHARNKRGLINPLGSIIKIITGNLDHDDALKYDRLFEQYKKDQITTNEKISIISQTIESFTNNSELINNNFNKIAKKLERFKNELNTTKLYNMHYSDMLNTYNLLMHNFRTIYIRLSELETALAFSKLLILHQSIINSQELLSVLKIIEKHNKLICKVEPQNLIKIEQSLTLKAYMKNHIITFIIEVPLVQENPYTYYRLYPLPMYNPITNQTLIVNPLYPYLLANDLSFGFRSSPCKTIVDDDTYICYEQDTTYDDDSCVIELMKYTTNTMSCFQVPIHIEDVKLQRIRDNRWILYSRKTNVITNKCNHELSKQSVQGTYILTIDDTCECTINDIHLKLNKFDIEDSSPGSLPIISLPEISSQVPVDSPPVNLEKIDLSDIRYLSYVLKQSKSDVTSVPSASAPNILLTITIILMFLIFSITILYFVYQRRFCKRNDPSEIHNSSDNSIPNRGGVMPSTPFTPI